MPSGETIHASVAVVDGRGVLIRGASGAGKSSLLLALLFGAPPATLVADDRVQLTVVDGRLVAEVPDEIAGVMEVRGVGIIRVPHLARTTIDLVVELASVADCPRLPVDSDAQAVIAGIPIRRIWVAIGSADGAFRVRAALLTY